MAVISERGRVIVPDRREPDTSGRAETLRASLAAIVSAGTGYVYAPRGLGADRVLEAALRAAGSPVLTVAAGAGVDGPQVDGHRGVVVVVDDSDQVGPAQAARWRHRWDAAAVVVLGRRRSDAWSRGGVVVTPSMLVLDAGRVLELLAAAGVPAADHADVVDQTGCWPSLVDAYLEGDVSEALRAARRVVAAARRAWLPGVSSHDESTVAVLAVGGVTTWAELAQTPSVRLEVVDELIDLGVAIPAKHGEAVRLVPALAQTLREDRHESCAQAATALAQVRERLGTGDCGLGAALEREDWDACGRILDRWWPEIVFGGHRDLSQRVTLAMSEAALRSHPGAGFRAEYLGRLPVGTFPLDLIRSAPQIRQAAGSETGILLLRRSVVAMIARRLHGLLEPARDVAMATEALADACRVAEHGPAVGSTPLWYLQAGISAQLAGDEEAGRRFYRKGWQVRSADTLGFVARDLATKLALSSAVAGQTAEARSWLAFAEEQPRPNSEIEGFLDVGERATRLILAVDAGDLDRFDTELAQLGDAYVRDEFWPYVVGATVRRHLLAGDHDAALRMLAKVERLFPATSIAGGVHGALLSQLEAEVLLAAGRAAPARAVLHQLGAAPAAQATLALLQVLTGDAETATRTVAAARRLGESPRASRRLAVVEVVAARRSGADRAAAELLATLVDEAVRSEAITVLCTVPRADLEALAGAVPAVPAVLAQLDAAGLTGRVPGSLTIVDLTDRELTVLRAVEQYGTNDRVARELFVSPNTVKTQLRTAYAKLGVGRRDDALVAARRLGLLPSADGVGRLATRLNPS